MADLAELKANLSGISEFCRTKLVPEIERFEREHKLDGSEIREGFLKALVPASGGWALGFLDFKYIPFLSLALYAVAVCLVLPAVCRYAQKAGQRMKAMAALRADIKRRALNFLDAGIVFTPNLAFPKELYHGAGLFPTSYDRAHAEDHCAGVIGETRYELQEVAVHNVKRSKNSKGETTTTYIPVFCGLIFKADFNKNFQGHTTLVNDYAESKFGFVGRGAQRILSAAKSSPMKLVELESPVFEARYKVQSMDPVQARYILTPDFMERIMAVDGLFPGVQIAFRDGAIIVAIPRAGNFLELKHGLKEIAASVEALVGDLITILEITEDLKLNERIWNKKVMGA